VNDYPGAVILVSHDRHLLEACADRLWLVADGTVKPYEGDLDQYRRDVLRGGERSGGKEKKNGAAPNKPGVGPITKKIQSLETQVQKLEEELSRLDGQLSDADLHQRNPREASSLAEARTRASDALAKAEAEWLELSAQREAMGA
jgi:ATP-binding cassette subfamily F protein 3